MPDDQGNLPYQAPAPIAAPLPARVWRLTHVEYRTSVKALTAVDVDTSDFEAETDGGLFANISNVNFVRLSLASSYYDTAARVGDTITEAQLKSLAAPCGALTAACKSDFIRTVAGRAYRRPATSDDSAELGEIFDLAVASGDAALPFRSVVQAVVLDGLTTKEAGRLLGVRENTVKIRLHRAKAQLRTALAEPQEGWR